MKVRMRCDGAYGCFKKGDIVDCIKGKDLPKKHMCVNDDTLKSEFFCKGNDGEYWYVYEYEFDVLEEESETDKLLVAAASAKEIHDVFIKVGFSEEQAFNLISDIIVKGLTN